MLRPRRLARAIAAALPLVAGLPAALSATAAHADDTALPQVEVSAERTDFENRQTTASTRLIYGREELDRMNELTVGDYLRRLPSVTFTGPPGSPKDVRVRGMDKGYTQILIDGEPVPGGGKERQIQVDRLPLDLVERIEIIRAPTADLPNEGLAGTINIVLRDVPSQRVASARLVTGRLFGEKATADSYNLSGQYGTGDGHVRWLLSGALSQRGELKTKRKSEETFNAAGTRTAWRDEFEDERTRVDGFDFAPRLNVKLDGGDELVLTPFVSRTDERKDKAVDKFRYASPATGTGYVGDGRRSEVEDKSREIARLRGEWKHRLAGDGRLSVFAGAQAGGEDKAKTTREFNAAGAQTKLTLENASQDEREWKGGIKLTQPVADHKLTAGLEYEDKSREDRKSTVENGVPKAGGRSDNFVIDERKTIAYLQDEIKLAKGHVLTPGVRAQWIDQQGDSLAGAIVESRVRLVSPSLHYLWQMDGRNNLRASLTETVKPAKFDQLSPVTETKAGTLADPDVSGNPALQPEKAIGAELGWEHFLPRGGGVLGANLFYRDISDKVEERTNLEGARFVKRPFNVGDAEVWGIELDARPRMDIIGLPELMLRFNYTWLDSELRDTATGLSTRIKDQPPYVYNIGFDWQLPAIDGAFGMNYNYTPTFVKNPAEIGKADPEAEQQLLDLYVMKKLGRDLAVRFTASNLLDMRKDKDKREFNPTTGALTKRTLESERGGRAVFVALEGKW